MNFKSWLNDLGRIQKVVNGLKDIDAVINGSTNLLTNTSLSALSASIKGLTADQAILALSTKNLTAEQLNQVLSSASLISSNNNITLSMAARALQSTSLLPAEKKLIFEELGLVDSTTHLAVANATCTKEALLNALATRGIVGAEADAIVSSLGLSSANAGTAVSFKVLSASILSSVKAIGAFLLTNPVGMCITAAAAIYGLAKAYDALTLSQEEILEKAEEAQSAVDESRTNFNNLESNINNIKDRYAELAQGVKQTSSEIQNLNLTPDEYEEFLSLSNQLADISPTLVSGYDSQGNAILNLSGDVDTITSSLDDFIEKQRELANLEIADRMPDLYAGTNQESKNLNNEIKNLESRNKKLEEYRKNLSSSEYASSIKDAIKSGNLSFSEFDTDTINQYKSMLDELGIAYRTYSYGIGDTTGTVVLDINASEEEIDKALSSFNDKVSNLSSEYLASIGDNKAKIAAKQQELNQTWTARMDEMLASISTESSYKMLSDQARNTFQSIFNNLDFGAISSIEGNDTWDGIDTWINNNIIAPLNGEGSAAIQAAFSKMFDLQDALDSGTISVQEYLDGINNQISNSEVFGSLDENVRNSIQKSFKYTSQDGATIEDMISNVKEKISDEMDGAIEGMSLEDLEIAYNIENKDMTFDQLQSKILQTKKLAETGFDINARTNLNAYNDVKGSDNGGSYRADYDSYTAMMKEAKDLYDASRTGNETFKAAAKAFSMNGMDDAVNFAENYAQLSKYFTEDSSGLETFVQDLEKIGKAEWNGKAWVLDMENMQEAADQLYMPLEMLTVLMEGLQEYGFTNDYFGNMEDGTAHLTDLYKQLAEEKSKLEQMYKDKNAEGTEIQAQEDLVESIQNSIETTKNGIQQLIDALSSEELDNAYKANKDAIRQLMDEYNKNLEDPSVLGDSFDYVQESLKSAIEQISEEYNIPIKFDVDTNKADFDTTLQDIESRINEYTKILSDYNAGKIQLDDSDVEQAKESLQLAYEEKQQLTAPAIMSVDTSQIDSDVADLITKLQSVVDTSNQIEINKAIGADTSELESDLRSTLADINSTPAEVKAELGLDETNFQVALANIDATVQPGVTLNQSDLDTITSTISAITPQMVVQAEVADEKVNEYAAEEKESTGKVIWDNVHDKVDQWIAQTHEANGTVVWKNDTSRVKTTFTATGVVTGRYADGTAHTLGTAHANGTVGMALWNRYFSSKPGSAYVKGDWRLPHDENALVGELGAELLVRDGKASLIGVNGAEFKGLKRGDIIFNHKQVEALLKYGYITGRGKPIGFTSHAMGTVNSYAGGSTGSFGGYQTTKASSASSSASTKANTKAVSENTKSVEDLKEKFDSYTDWIAKFIDAFDKQYAQMERMASDLQDSYSQQNSTINQMISLTQKFQSNYEKMYDTYMAKAQASGLSATYQNKVINGEINIESITDESLKEKISEFEKWYSTAVDLQDKVQELNVTLKELYNQKLENIEDDYSRVIDYYDAMTDRYKGIIEMREAIGKNADGRIIEPFTTALGGTNFESYYNSMMSNTITKLDLLYKQYNEMNAELARMVKNGQIQAYSDDWYEWQTKLQEIFQSIDDAKTQYAEIRDELRAYHWKGFNANIDTLDYNIKELQDVLDHLNSNNFVDELGNITEEGDANITLIATVLDKYKQKLADYTTAVKKLDEELKNGVINQEQYTEYVREYLDAIRETSGAIDDYKNQLIDLYKQQIDIENDTLQKNISLRKEALQKKKDYYDYDKTIRDKNKDINALKSQIAAMEGVTSASGKAELARLKAQLAEAEDDLNSTKIDHQFEMMSTGYDELSDKADEAYDAVLDSLTRSTEEQERVINEMLERIKTSYKDAYSEIAQTITDAGILLSEDTQKAIDSIGTSSGAANASDKAQTANSDVSSSSTANNVKTSIDSSAKTDKNTVTSISLNKSSATIAVGGSVKLTASVSPAGTTNPVSWSSSNTGVATVSGGTVTGKKAGTAKITATCGMRTATCTVTVKAASNSSGNSGGTSNLKTATNTTDGHNLRDAAGYSGKIITSMPKGSTVTLLGDKKEADGLTWYKVKYGSQTGWTSSYYLKFAKGSKYIDKEQLAIINEKGREILVSPSTGTILLPFDSDSENGDMVHVHPGDGVIKHDWTETLMQMGRLGVDGFADKVRSMISIPEIADITSTEQPNYNFGDYKVEIYPTQKLDRQEIRKISDYCYDDWFDRAKNDQRAAGFKHR